MKRFFSEDSFWNTPLPANPEIDPRSEHCIRLLESIPFKHYRLLKLPPITPKGFDLKAAR
jgi:hypothetical protein